MPFLSDGSSVSFTGTGPVTSLSAYRDFAQRFRPDAVVVGIYTDNDFTDDAGIAWRRADGELIEEPFTHAPGDVGKVLKANSSLVMAGWALGAGRREQKQKDGTGPAATDASDLRQKSSCDLAGVPAPIFDQISADRTPAIVVLFPDHTTFTDARGWDYARPATRLLHERLAEHFAQRGAAVITGSELLGRYSAQHGAMPFTSWSALPPKM